MAEPRQEKNGFDMLCFLVSCVKEAAEIGRGVGGESVWSWEEE